MSAITQSQQTQYWGIAFMWGTDSCQSHREKKNSTVRSLRRGMRNYCLISTNILSSGRMKFCKWSTLTFAHCDYSSCHQFLEWKVIKMINYVKYISPREVNEINNKESFSLLCFWASPGMVMLRDHSSQWTGNHRHSQVDSRFDPKASTLSFVPSLWTSAHLHSLLLTFCPLLLSSLLFSFLVQILSDSHQCQGMELGLLTCNSAPRTITLTFYHLCFYRELTYHCTFSGGFHLWRLQNFFPFSLFWYKPLLTYFYFSKENDKTYSNELENFFINLQIKNGSISMKVFKWQLSVTPQNAWVDVVFFNFPNILKA